MWDAMHETERLALLNKIYLPDGPIDLADCSRTVYDELPGQVRNDLKWLDWSKL
jgi:hypothetical protein